MYFQNYFANRSKKIGDFHKPSADAARLLLFNIVDVANERLNDYFLTIINV